MNVASVVVVLTALVGLAEVAERGHRLLTQTPDECKQSTQVNFSYNDIAECNNQPCATPEGSTCWWHTWSDVSDNGATYTYCACQDFAGIPVAPCHAYLRVTGGGVTEEAFCTPDSSCTNQKCKPETTGYWRRCLCQ